MLFNSIDFTLFLPIVFSLYWILNSKGFKIQNILLLLSSYVFYGWWDWRFTTLMLISTVIDFRVANLIDTKPKRKKIYLALSLFSNLGLLAFFKYYNFFIESFNEAFTFFGNKIEVSTLNIVLPVGISFYTFQTISYSIDVYRGNFKACKDPIAFAAYVSFFPQLVAGPIERATSLLPQFLRKREFTYSSSVDGLKQMMWGLFKKVVIADTAAIYVNQIFDEYSTFSGWTLILGSILFAFQIYGDFSGYSDIAIGTSKLFGFNLNKNFNFPYFSRDIAEFWRRWHISLSTWFRDYVYIPLGGSRTSKLKSIRNVLIIFLLSGFWHGANWTFIMWGLVNAMMFVPLMLLNRNRKHIDYNIDRSLPAFGDVIKIFLTFGITCFAWIFFRSPTISDAFSYITIIFSNLFNKESIIELYNHIYWNIDIEYLIILALFILLEWIGRNQEFTIKTTFTHSKVMRWTTYYLLLVIIFLHLGTEQTFIYFQF